MVQRSVIALGIAEVGEGFGEVGCERREARIDAEAMTQAMNRAYQGSAMLLDPHTAIGLAAAHAAELPRDVPVVTLATAHPAKFPDAVERATGQRPTLPARVGDLFERQERYDVLPAELDAIEAFVAARAVARA